ncbi:MAG: hypothetical protein U0520_02870 [Candidatus Saccharimonadales bacterium]
MASRFEQGRYPGRVARTALFGVALVVSGCGGGSGEVHASDDVTTEGAFIIPTAAQVAAKEGGSVSQFPVPADGAPGIERFCGEIGAVVTGMGTTSEGEWVDCIVSDMELSMDPDSTSKLFLEAVCRIAGGTVIEVAMRPNQSQTIAACHTGQAALDEN